MQADPAFTRVTIWEATSDRQVEYHIGVLEKKTIHFTWASGKI